MDRQGTFPRISRWLVVCALAVASLFAAPTIHAGTCTVLINPATLLDGTAGVNYSTTITASNCSAPYSFGVTSGSLPPGLTLQSATSTTITLAGTPTTAGTFNFTIGAIDQFGFRGSRAYTVIISPST